MDISVVELGTSTSIEQEEENMLLDFPRSVKYSSINFKANMKIDSTTGDPVVTDMEADDKLLFLLKLKTLSIKNIRLIETWKYHLLLM